MSSTQVSSDAVDGAPRPAAVAMRVEVVVIPDSDLDRATAFYGGLGWRLDVDDGAAREELLSRGVEVSEVFHDPGGGHGGGWRPGTEGRAPGHEPQRRSYGSYASFLDPDGNTWLVQELTNRLSGRV